MPTGHSSPETAGGRGQELTQGIAQAARAATSRAVEIAGGGIALLFANTPDSRPSASPPLRAAAGFPSPESARQAAEAVGTAVGDVVRRGEVRRFGPVDALGPRAGGGLAAVPLMIEDRIHGALLVAGPAPLLDSAIEALTHVCQTVALRLDHAVLRSELAAIEDASRVPSARPEHDGDELLRMSEQLFAQDIELRRSSEELGKIERLKDDFIEKMSRELRTPLNHIIESVISVLASENDSLTDESRVGLRTALDEGTAFLRTLQNILDLWRIKQGELPVESQDVNFPDVLEEVLFSVQDELESKPIEVERALTDPFPKVRTDLAKLHQILFLLIENAARFTRKGRISIRASEAGGELRVEVADTGIGIAPDDRRMVFDEFYQVDESRSSGYRGAGLGLSLVRDLLILLDGRLTLKSEIGEGTRVAFSIPVQVVG